jgi:small subunit ribosomal protein S20
MANKKSSKKDLRRVAKRTLVTRATRSALKTFIKKTKVAVTAGVEADVKTTLAAAMKALDKASQNGVIHPNQAARRKSRLAKKVAAAAKVA